MQQTYNCPNCSALVAYGEPFCRNCGTTFTWEVPQPPSPPPPPSYDYQQYNQQQDWGQQQPPEQAGWNQQPGWNQPPPANQQTGWGYPNQYQQQYGYTHPGTKTQKKKPLNRIHLMIASIAILIVIGGIGYAATEMFPTETKNSPLGDLTPSSTSPVAPVKPPVIASFTISPTTIRKGQTTTLSWNVTGATAISIDQGIGTVSASGTKAVSPTETTTTYVLTATNDTGYMSASTTVTISEPVVPVINNFTANPASISSGQTSSLQWNVSGATSITIDQGIDNVSASGSRDVNPSKTTTYTLTATNREGTVTASATVNVGTAGAPVVTSFTANPANINASETSTLQWNVAGATSVSLNQDVVISSGSKEVTPTVTTIYTLTARNNIGTVTASATVTVGGTTALSIDTFKANPTTTYDPGGKSTLQWIVLGATSISITDIGNVSASGTQDVYITGTKTFILTATNSTGQTATKPVTVNKGTAPVITSFSANPSIITAGQPSTLQWTIIEEVTSISIDPDNVTPSQPQSHVVTPAVTTTYTLKAKNGIGDAIPLTTTVTVTGNPP